MFITTALGLRIIPPHLAIVLSPFRHKYWCDLIVANSGAFRTYLLHVSIWSGSIGNILLKMGQNLMRILLVEDNEQLSSLMVERLATRDISVDSANSVRAAQGYFSVGKFDAIVLDLGLPDGDGISWLKSLPQDKPPVLILSARSALAERVMGLDSGADDYLVKPAQIDEIAARLRALVRRPGARDPIVFSNGNVNLDPESREVRINGQSVQLGKKEFDFLEILMRRAGSVVGRETLEGLLYSASDPVTPNALEAVASRLRRRLVDSGEDSILHTVRGVGYYFGKRGAK